MNAVDTSRYHAWHCDGCRSGHHTGQRAPIEIALAVSDSERSRLFGPMSHFFMAVEIPSLIAERAQARHDVPWMRPLSDAEAVAAEVTLRAAAALRRADHQASPS